MAIRSEVFPFLDACFVCTQHRRSEAASLRGAELVVGDAHVCSSISVILSLLVALSSMLPRWIYHSRQYATKECNSASTRRVHVLNVGAARRRATKSMKCPLRYHRGENGDLTRAVFG